MPLGEAIRWDVPADLPSVGRLVREAASFLEERGVAARPSYGAQLLIEETVSNIVRHAPSDGAIDILVEMTLGGESITIVVSDSSPPYDPLKEAPPPDTDSDLESRPVGGLGVHLMKTFADSIEYARVAGRNRLTMRIRLQVE